MSRNNRSKNNKSQKVGNRKAGSRMNSLKRNPLLRLEVEFPGQAHTQQWLSANPLRLITTVTSGEVSNSFALATSSIPNFTTRFAAFQECRVVGARVRVELFSSTQPGMICHWFESGLDVSAPSATDAINQIVKRFPASDVFSPHGLQYIPSDPLELQWAPLTGTATIAGNYNVYTDNANYGAPIVVTALGIAQLDLLVQLRGLI
jgi:hypothetical protein